MKRTLLILCAASLAGALRAADGDLLASTASPSPAFEVWTADTAIWTVADAAAIAALPNVTWRVGETVTAMDRNDTVTTLATSAATAGSAAFAPDAGGVWTLENSVQGAARIGVPWSVFADGGTLDASAASPGYVVDAKEVGTDRRTSRLAVPPLAWTCDHWARGPSAAATLTLTAPSGAETVLPRTGTGAESFDFSPAGIWTATLAMADGTALLATLNIMDASTVLYVR